jgi:YesN/AraC family two-component response regulator
MNRYIKNMICSHCKMVVKSEIENFGLHLFLVDLGDVETVETISDHKKKEVTEHLKSFGFQLIDDKKSRTIDKIKTLIIDLAQNKNNEINTNLSYYLAIHLFQDYNTLSNLFSEVENTTIEKFFIHQKIEKVKELLIYDKMNLGEIAFMLNYSSVAYLSNQ